MPEDRQSQLKLLIARGKEQGYLTYSQVNDHLPSEIVDPEQIEDIVNTASMLTWAFRCTKRHRIPSRCCRTSPRLPLTKEAIEEAAAALAALDAGCFGRTTDPVRMCSMRMRWRHGGAADSRRRDVRIAKRIEEGLDAVRRALAMYPAHL